MSQTMFARAAAPKSNLGLAVIVGTLALIVGGFVLSSASLPRPHQDELRTVAPAAMARQA
jgi:hypothetical protein